MPVLRVIVTDGRTQGAGRKQFSRPRREAGAAEAWKVRLRADGQDLAAGIIAANRARPMGLNRAAALPALSQLRSMPAERGFVRAKTHLRFLALWNSHGVVM